MLDRHIIPIRADYTDPDELSLLLSGLTKQIPDISVVKPAEGTGLAMETNIVDIITKSVEVGVPILISAIAEIWKRNLDKKRSEKPVLSNRKPIVTIETEAQNIRIDLSSDKHDNINSLDLPDNISEITRIRLEAE